jgi:DNA-binding NtrC family response regulator
VTRPRILVVDDRRNILTLFARILSESADVTTESDGARAIALIASERFDVVVTDLRMPGADGFAVLKTAKAVAPDTEVIMMTAYATIADAVEAMKQGAYDYLQKPFEPDDAALVIARAVERKRLRERTELLQRELDQRYGFHQLVGKSPAMRQVYGLLQRAAALDITVLLTGETGTGKELAARAIHEEGRRKDARFVAVNCGALPADLIESELFGHARGAFTGAAAARAGLFEEAHGGTIFLDEIGELPLALQVKLNRVLQEREIRRVGETRPVAIDVRVIAATHRDLRAEVAAGRFREDLYFRLNVFPVMLPALRDRREDVPVLAGHFLAKAAGDLHREVTGFEPEVLRALMGYDWPGNVRELQNAIERAVAVARGPVLSPRDLPVEVTGAAAEGPPASMLATIPYRDALEQARERTSRDYLAALMREFDGNVTRAAERAGMERESLHRLLRRYGVRSEDYKRRS